jgi:hypothetical protein
MSFYNRPLGRSDVEAELRPLCGENSHPQYPLLRSGYSPTSRYPAGDFTPWIAKKLTERHFDDIAYLLDRLTQANPGISTGGSSQWDNYAAQLCNIDLRKNIAFEDEKGYIDLHTALFPYVLHGSLDGFMIVSNDANYLARAISSYRFTVQDLESKIEAANRFIKEMRRETKEQSTAWTDCPLFKPREVNSILSAETPAANLRAKLREMSIGARQLFFGTLEDGAGQGGWGARPYGINEHLAAIELTDSGLGELVSDASLVLATYRNEELFTALKGHPIKQGWKKKSTIKYILENAPEVAERLTKGKTVLAVRREYLEEGTRLLEWVSRVKSPLIIALGFLQ